MQPRSTLALPLTIRAWLAKCKLHFAGRLFFRWLTLVTFLLGLVAALALYVSDLGHLRAQVEIRSLLFPNMLSPNILLDHSRSRRKWRDFSGTRTATLRPSPELVDAPFSTGCSRPLRGPNVQQPGHVIVQPVAPACAMRRKDRIRMPCSSKSG